MIRRIFMSRLSTHHQRYTNWYETGESLEDALSRKVSPFDYTSLLKLIERGQQYTDVGHELMPDLGCASMLWNGEEGNYLSFNFRCGVTSKWVRNTVNLNLPLTANDYSSDHDPLLIGILVDVVNSWEPDFAYICDFDKAMDEDYDAKRPYAGILSYISDKDSYDAIKPYAADIKSLDSGLIIKSTEDKETRMKLIQTLGRTFHSKLSWTE